MASAKRPVLLDAGRPRLHGLEPVSADEKIKADHPASAQIDESSNLLLQSAGIVPWEAPAGALHFDYVGPQALDVFGYPLEMWYEEGFWTSHIHPNDLQEVLALCRRSSTEAGRCDVEYRMFGIDGRIVWLRHLARPSKENSGSARLRGFFIDITDRKQANAAVKDKELRLSTVDQSVKDGLFVLNVEPGNSYRFASVDAAFLQITGLTRNQVIGRQIVEVIGGPDAGLAVAKFGQAVRENKSETWEEVAEFPVGERICEFVATPIVNEIEERSVIVGAIHDVTA